MRLSAQNALQSSRLGAGAPRSRRDAARCRAPTWIARSIPGTDTSYRPTRHHTHWWRGLRSTLSWRPGGHWGQARGMQAARRRREPHRGGDPAGQHAPDPQAAPPPRGRPAAVFPNCPVCSVRARACLGMCGHCLRPPRATVQGARAGPEGAAREAKEPMMGAFGELVGRGGTAQK